MLRRARKSTTGNCPRTPFVVSRAWRPKPSGHTRRDFLESRICAPVRLLPIRAPRQAVLRTSSRLASPSTSGPCDPQVKKTHDASNRRLPPKRLACTRTSHVPDPLSLVCPAGRPHGVLGSVRPLSHRGARRFTTPEPASADRHCALISALLPHGLESEAWACSSHGVRAIEPLTPLSQTLVHPPPPRASPELLTACLSFGEVGAGRTVREPAEITLVVVS